MGELRNLDLALEITHNAQMLMDFERKAESAEIRAEAAEEEARMLRAELRMMRDELLTSRTPPGGNPPVQQSGHSTARPPRELSVDSEVRPRNMPVSAPTLSAYQYPCARRS